jgi:hypothetical protein
VPWKKDILKACHGKCIAKKRKRKLPCQRQKQKGKSNIRSSQGQKNTSWQKCAHDFSLRITTPGTYVMQPVAKFYHKKLPWYVQKICHAYSLKLPLYVQKICQAYSFNLPWYVQNICHAYSLNLPWYVQ